jgi:hypothetical protein
MSVFSAFAPKVSLNASFHQMKFEAVNVKNVEEHFADAVRCRRCRRFQALVEAEGNKHFTNNNNNNNNNRVLGHTASSNWTNVSVTVWNLFSKTYLSSQSQ